MSNLLQDLRYAARQFLKSPGFTISAIVSLALGIGATTAFFSLVYAVVFDPFPYRNANRIVYVQLHGKEPGYGPFRANGGQFEDVRNAPPVEDVFFQKPPGITTLTGENSRVVKADFYSLNIFGVLGVPPLAGRVFTPADGLRGNPAPLAVLSYRFWREHHAGNREVLGKTIELDHTPYMVIGVMPPRFTWLDSDVYLPGAPSADPHEYWMVFPKLKQATNLPAAEAAFQFLVDRFAKEDPNDYPQNSRVKIVTLNHEALGSSGTIIADLFAAAVVLLIIGCANVSILLLARGTTRQHEFAVRASVGAGRGRLIRQLLTESVLLSAAGATFGVLAAYWAVKAMPRMLPEGLLPHEVAVQLNVPVLLFSAIVGVITEILFGLSPALELSRPQLASRLQSSSAKIAGGTRARRMHRLPIAGQMALTLLLLSGAGGAAKAFLARLHALHGFDPDRVLIISMSVDQRLPAAPTTQQRIQAMETARRDVADTPGVAEAGFSLGWWPGTATAIQRIEIRSKPALNTSEAAFAAISPQLLSVLRVPLLRGRIFDGDEVQRQAHLAMVNQAFCKQYLRGLDPIGQRVRMPDLNKSGWNSDDWMEVIGVFGDATNGALDDPQVKPAVFIPYTFSPARGGLLYARASDDPVTAIRSVRARLREGVVYAETLQWELDSWGWGRERLMTEILGLYAGVALVLAAAGLYGVVSFAVTQRTQELGIRMALGAGRGAVVQLVLASTAAMLGVGVVAGFIISAILGPVVSARGGGGLLEPLNLLGAALVLVIVAAIACALPAWRAASIDPMQALRVE
jgi:predicted permease